MIFWCCKEIGINPRQAKYCLLGDDILIGDGDLARAYRQKIESLGVEVSAAKTIESKYFSEFAKRYIFKGQEVSPFPISSIIDNTSTPGVVVSAMIGAERKGLYP